MNTASDLFGILKDLGLMDKIFETRICAIKNMSHEIFEANIGKFLGYNTKIVIDMDESKSSPFIIQVDENMSEHE